jgi:hypothetical protein
MTSAHDVPATPETLIAQSRALGLRTGDIVMIHASMRRVGPVVGGAAAVTPRSRYARTPTNSSAANEIGHPASATFELLIGPRVARLCVV